MAPLFGTTAREAARNNVKHQGDNLLSLPNQSVPGIKVLVDDNATDYMNSRRRADHHPFVLDLTHEVQRELPHGLTLTMNRADSGLKALAWSFSFGLH